ncbi:MAG: ATP-binding protein, partial [Candidatus Eisenbacteria bacterium]|nr:ATP-binding protein [Candidatus Eisenbacteria bacterium]
MPESTTQAETISVRIPSRLELLGVLDRVADMLSEGLDFDEDARSQITMSVIEAGTNAIQHGHKRNASLPVDIEFNVKPDALEIVVHDTGPGFDLKSINGDMTSPEHLLDPRGRGIYIMRSCMDGVDYDFSTSGTTCRLTKKRPPAH